MKDVLMAVLIYLALITTIFYIVGYIIGIKFDAKRKIIQRAKEQFQTEKTFKEALEVYPEMPRKRYKKICLRQDALLIGMVLALMIVVVSVNNRMNNWDGLTSKIAVLAFVVDALVMFLMAYKGAEYIDDYYNEIEDDEVYDENADEIDDEKMEWYDIAGKWINNDGCKAIDVVRITDDYTLAYAKNEKGEIITFSYLDAGNLVDNDGRLNLDDNVLESIKHIKDDIKVRVKNTTFD